MDKKTTLDLVESLLEDETLFENGDHDGDHDEKECEDCGEDCPEHCPEEEIDDLVAENIGAAVAKTVRPAVALAKRKLGPAGRKWIKKAGHEIGAAGLDSAKGAAVGAAADAGSKLINKVTRKPSNEEINMETYNQTLEGSTLDTKSEEDPNLYQDATGKGAIIDTDKGTEGKDKKNKSSINAKSSDASSKIEAPPESGSSKERLQEHLVALFDGENLTEDFKVKASTIFEAAINERVLEIEESLTTQYQDILEEHIGELSETLSEKIDDYLSYVIEQWMNDNKLELETGIRTQVAENFISGLKVLFENNYIDMPDERYDVLDTVVEQSNQMQENLNNQLQENINLRKQVVQHECKETFLMESSDMIDTDAERFASLSAGIEFDTVDQYKEKLSTIKESYFGDSPQVLNEAETTNQQISRGGSMDMYMNTIHKHNKNS